MPVLIAVICLAVGFAIGYSVGKGSKETVIYKGNKNV